MLNVDAKNNKLIKKRNYKFNYDIKKTNKIVSFKIDKL